MLEKETLKDFLAAIEQLDAGFANLPPFEQAIPGRECIAEVLSDVAAKLHDNYPYFHPLYAGQMLKPPHPVARLAYALAMWVNPNNHALDGGRASSAMEKEAVAELAAMFGWQNHLGHICSGGTVANLEALWLAGRVHPGKKIAASEQGHYTHARISGVLQLPFEAVPSDRHGRMDLDALEQRLKRGDVGTVVASIGTTATGSVDPLPEILSLSQKYGCRVHADAAYGGYFILTGNLSPEVRKAYDHLTHVDSIVIDPHKHGLQPYGCGCVLFRDPAAGKYYKHDSPYTYFSSSELHLGEISLECSRPGAAAVALWATQRLLPLTRDGEFARGLAQGREAGLTLYRAFANDSRWMAAFEPDLDIVIYAPRAMDARSISQLSKAVFAEAAKLGLHLALAELPSKFFENPAQELAWNAERITCLRSVLMKPEHADWTPRIHQILCEALEAARPHAAATS
jgi:tyrosine decarboxylase / aspartate 1-decarboxylase